MLQNIDQFLVFYQEHLCAIISVSNVHNKAVTRIVIAVTSFPVCCI